MIVDGLQVTTRGGGNVKTLAHESITKKDARHMSDVQLSRLGIDILDKHDLLLRCRSCNETWRPKPGKGLLPAGYWICPNKCNI